MASVLDSFAHKLAVPGVTTGLGVDPARAGTTSVRITVEVDDAQSWISWAKRHGINRKWLHTMTKGREADSWYVVERAIPRDQWVAVERLDEECVSSLS